MMGIVIIRKHIEIIYIILPVDMKYGVRELGRETVMTYYANILKIDTL